MMMKLKRWLKKLRKIMKMKMSFVMTQFFFHLFIIIIIIIIICYNVLIKYDT